MTENNVINIDAETEETTAPKVRFARVRNAMSKVGTNVPVITLATAAVVTVAGFVAIKLLTRDEAGPILDGEVTEVPIDLTVDEA